MKYSQITVPYRNLCIGQFFIFENRPYLVTEYGTINIETGMAALFLNTPRVVPITPQGAIAYIREPA